MKIVNAWLKRIFLVVGIMFLLLFVMVINNRTVHLVQLRGEMEAERAKNNDLTATLESLQREIEYAKSDDYAIEWARQQNMMQLDGDIVVVVLPEGDAEPIMEEVVETPEPEYDNWEAWRLWLTFQE